MRENVFNKVRNSKPQIDKSQAKVVKMLPSSTLLFVHFFDGGKRDAAFSLPRGNQVAS